MHSIITKQCYMHETRKRGEKGETNFSSSITRGEENIQIKTIYLTDLERALLVQSEKIESYMMTKRS